ncbi:hypothetical protein CspeluHIS016_0101190 [Cutaneotrichosporon spelunceum]|uniref:DUF4048 domain-containing protein n=1 Tax=Cutaneotrichosporon spelunceum TaxID=1672016 RepID=A0AAD3TLW5_9TREE|nr:hypothetical protein CspeluHIS016_0101190 [Cutaneotrichosporon spelunceum]
MADELSAPIARRLSQQPPSTPSPNPDGRLKRLSLVAARDGASPVRMQDEGRSSVDSLRTQIPASPSPRPLIATSPSPRPRHGGRQSSISYSPSVRIGHVAQGSISLRRDHPSLEMEEEEGRRSTDTLTLSEKHSDLLRMIAMRERRVNELKQELAIQEEALSSLRARWTAVARSDAVIPTSIQPPRKRDSASHTSTPSTSLPSLVRTHPNSVSTSSTASSLPTVPDDEPAEIDTENPSTSAALGGLWNAITADADETIQEGKRFWGQLLRTVGAAAGGNVPEEAARPMEYVRSTDSATGDEAKPEIPNLRSMASSFGFLPARPHTSPSSERRTSRASTKSPASVASTASRERSPVKSTASNGSQSPTRSVRRSGERRPIDKGTPQALPLLAPTPVPPERRLSARLKQAAQNPRPRQLTGEGEKAAGKEEEREAENGKGGDNPQLVTAALESVGW